MAEMYHAYRPGFLEVICGCMFAGKTEELIRRIKVLEFAKKKIMVFKPAIDNRYSDTMVASHAGSFVNSILIEKAAEIMDHVTPDVDVVAIDEVQFLDDEVIAVCDSGKARDGCGIGYRFPRRTVYLHAGADGGSGIRDETDRSLCEMRRPGDPDSAYSERGTGGVPFTVNHGRRGRKLRSEMPSLPRGSRETEPL